SGTLAAPGCVGFSKSLFRARGNGSNFLWEDVHTDGGYQSGDSFSRMIEFNDTFHGGTVRRCSAKWCVEDNGTSFWQGDGISSERDNDSITVEDSEFSNNGDGGNDHKATNLTLTRVKSWGNRANFKIWSPSYTITDCDVGDPTRRV